MPSNKKNTSVVSLVHDICCGLDVHKKRIVACLISSDAGGGEQSEVMEFETFTEDLIKLRNWLL